MSKWKSVIRPLGVYVKYKLKLCRGAHKSGGGEFNNPHLIFNLLIKFSSLPSHSLLLSNHL